MAQQSRTEFTGGIINTEDADGSVGGAVTVSCRAMRDDGVSVNATPYTKVKFLFHANNSSTITLTVDGITIDSVSGVSGNHFVITLEMWLNRNTGFIDIYTVWDEDSGTVDSTRTLVTLNESQTNGLIGSGFIVQVSGTNLSSPMIGYSQN